MTSTSQYTRTGRPGGAGPAPVGSRLFHRTRLYVARYCAEQHPEDLDARRALWDELVAILGINGKQPEPWRNINVIGGSPNGDAVLPSSPPSRTFRA